MDLNKMVNEALANIEASGFVEKKVQERLEQTIESIVDDLFRSYSDFGKELKNKVAQELQINLDELKLQNYNVLVLKAVTEKINQTVRLRGIEKLKEELDDMLTIKCQDVNLSELIEKFKEEELEFDDDLRGQEISFHVDRKYNWTYVSFDKKPNKGEYQCEYRLVVKEDGTIFSVKMDDKELSKGVIMGALRGIERELFKLYASGSKLIIDEDDVDTYYGECED